MAFVTIEFNKIDIHLKELDVDSFRLNSPSDTSGKFLNSRNQERFKKMKQYFIMCSLHSIRTSDYYAQVTETMETTLCFDF